MTDKNRREMAMGVMNRKFFCTEIRRENENGKKEEIEGERLSEGGERGRWEVGKVIMVFRGKWEGC